nr:hypothetical protein [uncultured Aeromicrobium sp.]
MSRDNVVVHERSCLEEFYDDGGLTEVLLIGITQVAGKEDQIRPSVLALWNVNLFGRFSS